MYLNAQSEYPVCREAVVQLITELCYSAIPRFTPATLHHAGTFLIRREQSTLPTSPSPVCPFLTPKPHALPPSLSQ
jgi:hypothetical protein